MKKKKCRKSTWAVKNKRGKGVTKVEVVRKIGAPCWKKKGR